MTRFLSLFLIAAALFATISPSASAVNRRTRKEVATRVDAAQPGAEWNTKGIEELDINCDGNIDYAISGEGNGVRYVAVVMGPINRTSGAFVVDLPTGSEGVVICDEDPKLMVQSSDYNPGELLAGRLPEGFRQSETCHELAMGLACMKFHIYWNHSASKLGVWN